MWWAQHDIHIPFISLGFPSIFACVATKESLSGSDGEASPHDTGDSDSIPGPGRSPRGGHGNPLQYFCLESPMDRGAWWATFQFLTKSILHRSEKKK